MHACAIVLGPMRGAPLATSGIAGDRGPAGALPVGRGPEYRNMKSTSTSTPGRNRPTAPGTLRCHDITATILLRSHANAPRSPRAGPGRQLVTAARRGMLDVRRQALRRWALLVAAATLVGLPTGA